MESNETTETVDSTNDETVEETSTEEVETKSEKPKLTDEQQYAIHQRELKKLGKRLGHTAEETPTRQTNSDDLDSGNKALLVAYGIKGKAELELAKTWMKRTGDDIDSLVEDDIFQAKLSALREAKASSDAVPKGNKRSSNSSVTEVDYWLAKGELPPDTADNRELRSKIVEAEYKMQKNASPFTHGSKLIIK